MRVSKILSMFAAATALSLGATSAFAQQANSDLAVSGMLSGRDSHDSDGHFFRSRSVNLTAGDTVEITAASSEFDTVLRVSGPGVTESNDDAPGNGTNSRVVFSVPTTGAYRVTVTSYNANETGAYQLAVRHGASLDDSSNDSDGDDDDTSQSGNDEQPSINGAYVDPSAASVGEIPPQPPAWAWDDNQHMFVPVGQIPSADPSTVAQNPGTVDPNAGTGTVYGVFVGVSNYGGSNNLSDTANDARNLERAFEQSGLIRRGNAIVLTDGRATSDQVRQAFHTLAPRVTSRDTFVFFFDGHGNHHEIELQSGPMMANEMSSLLDSMRGQQLVVLDSCYSGSLASVTNGRANRIGLFSSRANETSYVASEVHAGGWLAYYMIEAVRRGVSANGAMHVNDLVGFVQRGYGQRVNGQQHLVVASGAEQTATLWRTGATNQNVALAQ